MRKLIVACLAIAAFGVVPSIASALSVLTHPTGTVAPLGTLVTATNLNESVLSNGLGSVNCSTAILTGEVVGNSTTVGTKVNVTSAKFGGTTKKTIPGDEEPECTGTGFYSGGTGVTTKPPYCMEATGATDTAIVRGGKCSVAPSAVKFQLSVTVFGEVVSCLYEKTSLDGSFTTDPENVEVTFKGQEFTKAAGSGGECPSSGKLMVSLTLETDSVTTTPIYISS